MTALVVTDQGARIARSERCFVVERRGVEIHRRAADAIDRILLFGSVEITSSAVAMALRTGCDVVFLNRSGDYRGRLVGPRSRNVRLRVRQILELQDPRLRLELARRFVNGKVRNQRALLLRAHRRAPCERLGAAAARLRRWLPLIDRTRDLDALRGIEGAAAACYFGAFGAAVRHPDLRFERRTRRPPTDPINACLSFGYGVLVAVAQSVVERIGLDPMVGALHELDYGRPSLVLDLVEEWRPVLVDSVVLRLVNRRQLGPGDFGPFEEDLTADILTGESPGERRTETAPPPHAVRLRRTARAVLVRELLRRFRERVLVPARGSSFSYEAVLEQQARALARALEQGDPEVYSPFCTRT